MLDLLDAGSLEEVVGIVEDSLRHEFQVPFVGLILFSDNKLPVGRSVSSAEAHQQIGGLLSGGKTICGVLRYVMMLQLGRLGSKMAMVTNT